MFAICFPAHHTEYMDINLSDGYLMFSRVLIFRETKKFNINIEKLKFLN
jgi:hypothetical protein